MGFSASLNSGNLCCSSYMKKLTLNSNRTTSIDDLPHGLMLDIFSRLPVKTLIQSTCVSKLWFSLIYTPSLISDHLSRSISDPSFYCLFLSHDDSPSATVISDNPLITRHQDFNFPFQTQQPTNIHLIGACNGLICVTDSHYAYRGRDIYLVNPFIRKYRRLGVESSCFADFLLKNVSNHPADLGFNRPGIDINIGFGYSDVDDDYKVLRSIIRRADRRESVYDYKVEIYSLKNDKWKVVDVSIPIEVPASVSPTFVHGCFYWRSMHVTKGVGSIKLDEYLLCFDLKDEVYSRMEMPKAYFELFWTWRSDLLVRNGSLAIVLFTKDPESDSPFTKIRVVVLDKISGGQIKWEVFNYECANFNPRKCIGLCGGGRLMFVANSNLLPEYIVAVDIDNSCAIERLALDFTDASVNEAISVSESLVLLSDRIA